MLLLAVPAQANTPIEEFTAVPSTTQAGGHPDLEVNFTVKNRVFQHSHSACNCEDSKNATVHLPAGFIGNPHAAPQCSLADFSVNACPIDSQVGIAEITATEALPGEHPFNAAIYNLIPPPDEAGLLGFKLFLIDKPQFTVLSGRTGSDYGLDVTATSIYQGQFTLRTLREDLWGVPAAPIHDPLRLNPANNVPGAVGEGNTGPQTAYVGDLCSELTSSPGPFFAGVPSTSDPNTIRVPCYTDLFYMPPVVSNSPLTPFLQNPTTCGTPLSSSLDILSYDGGETSAEDPWPKMTGCDQLSFNPSLYAQPTTTETDTSSGIDVNLDIPQQLSPTVPSPSELNEATVTLPPGFSINPNAADGKTACTDAEAHFGTEAEAQCPEFSKVGSLTIDDPALPGPLPGFVYLGAPLPGNRYRLFLAADGFATHLKLPGTVTPDPQTGQLKITFANLPQQPLTAFNMHFFGSERGLLATPTQCGTYPVTSTFTPWDTSLAPQTSTQYFTLDSGPDGSPCPGASRPFAPGFRAVSAANTAGAHSPFSLELTRPDGDQNLSALKVRTPPGFSATLAGIPYCSDAGLAMAAAPGYSGREEEANPSCPPASQVGSALTGAGAGNHPLYVAGKVYLAGPYKGAPISLAVITPAISGPYDLGNVVVRVALRIDPATAQITAVSDPLPMILEGIPLRLRSIRIDLNRPNFTLNPTNCDPFYVNAEVFGDQGAVATPRAPLQVASCAGLHFAPKLSLRVSGGTRRAQNPALHAVLTAKEGESNIASTTVTLPHSEFLDNAHINNPCTRVQYAANACPASSVIGHAKAVTPLLQEPLEGPVFLRSSSHQLPDIVADLKGQIDIELDGRIDSVHERLRTSFETVPDAPVSRFALSLHGGKNGLLINSENLCSSTQRVSVKMTGQNGRHTSQSPVLLTPCEKGAKRKATSQGGAAGDGG